MNTYVRCIFEPNKLIYTQIKRTWPSQPWNHNRWDTAHLCSKLPKNGWGSNYFYDITKAAICKWLKKTMTKNKNKKTRIKLRTVVQRNQVARSLWQNYDLRWKRNFPGQPMKMKKEQLQDVAGLGVTKHFKTSHKREFTRARKYKLSVKSMLVFQQTKKTPHYKQLLRWNEDKMNTSRKLFIWLDRKQAHSSMRFSLFHKIRQINYFQSEGSHKIYSLEMEKHQNKSSFTKK